MSNYRHGKSGTAIHDTWMRMHDRCRNDRQGNYGKRGIRVCDRWARFENFYSDMGDVPTPQHSLDRIDVDGNYEPANCRWATRIEQARNTTRNTIIDFDGQALTIAGWAEKTGIKPATICNRIYVYGWSIERTLTVEPLHRLPKEKPWDVLKMSRSSWYRQRHILGMGNRV